MSTKEQAWSGLEELRPLLMSYLLRRCRDENEAEDILQETLLRAARYRASLTDPARLPAWAARIAANVLADHVRREARQRRVTATEELLEAVESPSAEAGRAVEEGELRCGNWVVEKDEALACLAGAIEVLGEEDRRVLDSYYRGAQSCRETARECRLPPELVKVRLFRARQRLLRAIRHRISTGRGRRAPLDREPPEV